MSAPSTYFNGYSPRELRALYQLILERMEVVTPADHRRWVHKVHQWNESVHRDRFHVTLRELVER